MKTLTLIMFSFFLIGTTFSQKLTVRTMSDLTIKPKGNMVLDSVYYDKGTMNQSKRYFNKDGSLYYMVDRRGNNGTERRIRYSYPKPKQVQILTDSVLLLYPGSCYIKGCMYWGLRITKLYEVDPNMRWYETYPIMGAGSVITKHSTVTDSMDVNGRILKSRFDSIPKGMDASARISYIYEYKYGEQGTVQISKFEKSKTVYGTYTRNADTLEIKSYARDYRDNLIEVDYFMTKTDTIVGYPFVFCLQPQPVPTFSKAEVVTTKDQYGNVLTASYNGHVAIFYYSKSATTSLLETKADNGLKVYPTIIGSTLNITDYNGLKTVSVFNLSGSLVHKEEVENNSMDLSFLSKGMYILSIETETGISNHKIIKQ